MSDSGSGAVVTVRRQAGIDAVRVLGMVAIVAGHIWSGPEGRWLYAWHVPLFFLLGGYFWNPGRSLAEEWRVRLRTIGRPYAFWWVVVGAVYVAWQMFRGSGHFPVRPVALALWGGLGAYRPWTAFWFFSAFFIAVLVARWLGQRGWWLPSTVAVVALMLCQVFPDLAMRAPLAGAAAIACVGFLAIGAGVRRLEQQLRRPGLAGILACSLGVAGILVPGYEPLAIKSAGFGTPVLSVVVAALLGGGLILVGSALGPRIPGRIGRSVSVVAQCATVVLLAHGIVLLVLVVGGTGGRWVELVLAVGLPLLFALATRRSRWAPWIHGRRAALAGAATNER